MSGKSYPSIRVKTTPNSDVLIDGDMVYTISRDNKLVAIDTTVAESSTTGTVLRTLSDNANLCYILDDFLAIGTAKSGNYGTVSLINTKTGRVMESYWPGLVDVTNICAFDDGYVYTFTQDGVLCRAKADGDEFEWLTYN